MDIALARTIVEALARRVIAHTDELTQLDQAIGDGDHGLNMKRGFEAVLADLDALAAGDAGTLFTGVGRTLVMKVGGASGPLYGTLFMQLGKSWPTVLDAAGLHACCKAAVEAVAARGKSQPGQKTMLDVLLPVVAGLEGDLDAVASASKCGGLRTGDHSDGSAARARFIPEGALDWAHGPRCPLQPIDDRGRLRRVGAHTMNVGIVIVSHSPDVAKGAADMVRQMVGHGIPLAWTGGNPDGGLGTSVEGILAAIDAAWSDAGVAILVDLGGAETNSEMAIEMLPAERQGRVVICDAPVVEGAVMAATEAWGGSDLAAVKRTAEELNHESD